MNPTATKEWAESQEKWFAGNDLPTENDLGPWVGAAIAQSELTPTNLSLCDWILTAAAEDTDTGRKWAREFVVQEFNLLHRNGFWIESYSYFLRCRSGFSWYKRVTGRDIVDPAIVEVIQSNYEAMRAPDGSIPLPECSGEAGPLRADLPDTVSTPSYLCKRWYSADREEVLAYLLVCLDTNPEPRLNLHHHCEAGALSLWIDGEWKVRIAKYTGFDLLGNTESRAVAENLPEGALLPTWRLAPPPIWSIRYPQEMVFTWDYHGPHVPHGPTRRISWDAASVTVCDNGTMRRWDLPQ